MSLNSHDYDKRQTVSLKDLSENGKEKLADLSDEELQQLKQQAYDIAKMIQEEQKRRTPKINGILGESGNKLRENLYPEDLHNQIDKKICQKVFEKVKECKGDRKTICNQIESCLLKNSSLKPLAIKNNADVFYGGWIDFYFDSKTRRKTLDGEEYGNFVITVMLKPVDGGIDNFETYLGYGNDNVDFSFDHQNRPVRIRHTDNERHYDSNIKSLELLEEKQKFYESLGL